MNITVCPLNDGQWFPERTEKKFVVWHGTGGRTRDTPVPGRPHPATAAIDAWNRNAECAGAPYLVDRDGTIYKTFDDSGWIDHLGLEGTSGRYDQASVAIAFANELGLRLDGDRLYAFDTKTPNAVYTGPFFHYEWRGFDFFAQPDEVQVDAAIELTLDVCHRHDIDPVLLPVDHIRFPSLFRGRDDPLPLQLPRGSDGPLSAGMGLRQDRGRGNPAAVVKRMRGGGSGSVCISQESAEAFTREHPVHADVCPTAIRHLQVPFRRQV